MLLELFTTLLGLLLAPATNRYLAATRGDGGHQFIYNGFEDANLTLDGTAMVTPTGLLMLTNGTVQKTGHAFHPSRLPFRDPIARNATAARSFSTTFVFAIFGQFTDLSSHGLAFFVAADRSVLASALPSHFLGLLNASDNGNASARVFAVEFDTLFNAEVRDPNTNHVVVDVDSVVSRHFVVSWSFALDGPARALDITALPALPPTGPKSRSKVLEIVLPIASAAITANDASGAAVAARPASRVAPQFARGSALLPALRRTHCVPDSRSQLHERV